MTIEGSTREEQPETLSGALRSGRDPGIGQVETDMVRALDDVCLFRESPGQGYEVFGIAAGGDRSPKTSPGLRGQCRRYEEASPFEVEEGIHALRIYAPNWRTVVDGVRYYFSTPCLCIAPHVNKRERRA